MSELAQNNFEETLSSRESSRKPKEMRNKIKKAIVILSAYVALGGAMERNKVFAEEIDRETVADTEHSYFAGKISPEEMRHLVVFGDQEHSFASLDSADSYREIKSKNKVGITAFNIGDLVRETYGEGAQKIYWAHTHPIAGYLSPQELTEIRSGQLTPSLGMPPSINDLIVELKLQDAASKRNITVTGVVFSSTGTWEYYFDSNDARMASFIKWVNAHQKHREMMQHKLSPRMQEELSQQQHIDPERLKKKDPDFIPWFDEIERFSRTLALELPDTSKAADEVQHLAATLCFVPFNENDINTKINNYVSAASRLGLKVKYKPY